MADIKPSDFNPMKRHQTHERELPLEYDNMFEGVCADADGCTIPPSDLFNPLPPDGSYPTAHRILMPGTCEACGCTEENACIGGDGRPCAWADEFHTLCTSCT